MSKPWEGRIPQCAQLCEKRGERDKNCMFRVSTCSYMNILTTPFVVLTNYHTLSGSKWQKFLLFQFWRPDVWNQFHWAEGVSSVDSGGSRMESPGLFQLLELHSLHSLAQEPFYIFKTSSRASSSLSLLQRSNNLSVTPSPSSSVLWHLGLHLATIPIIQANLISKSK